MTENLTYHEIYELYKNLVFKVAYDYSGNYDIAEDITQSTFMTLYVYFDEMYKSNLKSWLFTTAKYAALNYIKKAEREVLIDEYGEDMESLTSNFVQSAEEEVLAKEKKMETSRLHEKILLDLLEKSPRWYEAIMLSYYLKIPQKKVAEEMGVSVNVVHSMLYRAKEWIRKEYEAEYRELNED